MYILTSDQMRRIDSRASEKYGIPSLTLMENAAKSVYEEIKKRFDTISEKSFIIFCGKGNNGGDGYETARLLLQANADVIAISIGESNNALCDAAVIRKRFIKAGGVIIEAEAFLSTTDIPKEFIIVDAIFGTGINTDIKGIAADIIRWINNSGAPVISVDLPSGINTDTGQVMGIAVKADMTITFCLKKPAHFLLPGSELCGEIIIKNIGIPNEAVEDEHPYIKLFDKKQADKIIPRYKKNEHKGSCGKLLVIGGSTTMSGAPVMASLAAMRSGCGIVKLIVPENIYLPVAAKMLEIMVNPMKNTIYGTFSKDIIDEILEMTSYFDAVLIGCGMSVSEDTKEILYALIENSDIPMVIDADGINLLAKNKEILKHKKSPVVLTPHTIEISRLAGIPSNEVDADRIGCALKFAKEYEVTALIKGPNTITASYDGRVAVNNSGNPGMATAGSGDVLAGVIAAFAAREIEPFDAAAAAVYIHGKAGDLAAAKLSQYGLIASDIIDQLPASLKDYDYTLTDDKEIM